MATNPKQDAAAAATAAIKKNGSNGSGDSKQLVTVPQTFAALNSNGISQVLNLYGPQIAAALPKHIKPERMIQVVTTLVTRNPDLKKCTSESIIGAMLTSALLGLEPVPQFGQVYLIPYNNKNLPSGQKEAQFMLGYRGMIQLILRHPSVKDVYAVAVYEKDEFHYQEGLDRNIVHVPSTEEERGELTHAYAVLKTVNGGVSYVVLNRSNLKRIRGFSKTGGHVWNEHFEEMAKKSAIRQLFKYAPVATDVLTRVGLDGKVIHAKNAQEEIAGEGMGFDELAFGEYTGDAEETEVEEVTDAGDDDSNPAQATQAQILTIRKLAKEVAIDEMTEAELSEFLKSETKTARDADGWIAFLEKQKK